MTSWVFCDEAMPPEHLPVEAQERTGQRFKLMRVGKGWFYADGSLFSGFPILRWRMLEGQRDV